MGSTDDAGDASYFLGINRNKKGVALDLAKSAGRKVLLRLLADADVLIENFKPGSNLRADTPSGQDYADALDDFLKALGIAGFAVVANSFGTRVAQSYAYHYPGRIGRAVFTGTSLARAAPWEERAQALRTRAAMIERGGYGSGSG